MKAIVLCGGIPQAELIRNLKSRGIETILLDMNEQVVARKYADKFYPISVLDEEAVKQVTIDEKADMVLTACADQVLLVAAKVSEDLGLPTYIDYKTGVEVSNKSDMKRIFKANDIPTSAYSVMAELDESKICNMKYPLIVKPVDSYSSRGVRKVFNISELQDAFKTAVEISRTKTAIVEEFVEGIELTVDAYIENGTSNVLCISRLDKISGADRFVINRCSFPAQISENVKEQVAETCQKIANAFNLKDSPLLVQLIVSNEQISVLEFCARTGGGDKFRLIKMATGFDVVDAVVELTLGNKPHVNELPKNVEYITDEFIYGEPSVMDHLEGFEELKEKGIITEYYQLRQKGTPITEPHSSGDRVAYFTIRANSYEEMLEKHKLASSEIKVIDSNGKDVARHDIMIIDN